MNADEVISDIFDTLIKYFVQKNLAGKKVRDAEYEEVADVSEDIQHVSYDEEQCGRTK